MKKLLIAMMLPILVHAHDMKGLRKDQYRVGIDVQQTVFDGGAISSPKKSIVSDPFSCHFITFSAKPQQDSRKICIFAPKF